MGDQANTLVNYMMIFSNKSRCRLRRILTAGLPGLLGACLFSATASAGPFSVSPVRIYMTPKDRAVAVTVTNEGEDALVMQADLYLWRQKPGGGDDLTPTEDVFLSPPILKLAPKARQVVRLARLTPAQGGEQLAYRLILREVAEARPVAKEGMQVQIALAFSIPVFITPPGANHQLGCTIARVAPDTVRADCENPGKAYVHPRQLTLSGANGEKWASRDSGGYMLPGIKRSFELKHSGRIPAGKAKLEATLDDGSTRTFDVNIAE